MNYSEEQMVKGCIKRDEKSRLMLYQKYARPVYAHILRYTRNKEDAEDILQETFITVFCKIRQVRNNKSLWSWIQTISINQTLIYYRKKNRFMPKDTSMEDFWTNNQVIDESIVWKDDLSYQKLLEVVQKLPDIYRLVFNLCEIDGFTIKEAAEKLHCSNRICSLHLSRAKKLLQEKINDLIKMEVI